MSESTTLHNDSKADLLALYDDRIAAKDFKTAISIKVALAKLSVTPAPEPEQTATSFATQQAVVKYLVAGGWKSNDSTLSLHIQQRKLLPGADGLFTREAVESYAAANLINNPHRSEKTGSDDTAQAIKEEELRRQKNRNDKEEGTLVNADEVKFAVENMLISFRSRVLLIPRKLSSQLAQMTDQHQIEAMLNRELRDTLTTLSQYRPEAPETAE